MDLIKTLLIALGCILLGIVGGFAARSLLAGVILAVFVFVGWFLWNLFKMQEERKELQQADDEKKE
jgi:protein-S-isoprenylcysteine O-methyltransferase Ste14